MYEQFRPKQFHLNGNRDSPEGPATGKICHPVAMEVPATHTNNIILRGK